MDAIAEFVRSQYKNADRNRRDLQLKWEENRKFFNGRLYPDGDNTGNDRKWKKGEAESWRSDTFPGTTHSKVLSAFVICLDTVLAGGKIPFMLKPSDINKYRGGPSFDPKFMEKAIEAQTALINHQFAECKADRMCAKNLFSQALYGETYAKMGVKTITRSGWEQSAPAMQVEGIELDMSRVQAEAEWVKWSETIQAPHWFYVSVWDIFRDWEVDDLAECSFIIHRQITDNYWLNGRKGKPYFVDSAIEAALKKSVTDKQKSNPSVQGNEDTSNMNPKERNFITSRTRNRQNLEWWGRIPRKIVEKYESSLKEDGIDVGPNNISDQDISEGDEVEVHAMVMDGEDTIRYVRIDQKMRPFAYSRWEDNGDEWTSRGVADNCHEMSVVQRGTFRTIEDNTKVSGNAMFGVKRRFIKNMPKSPAPGLFLELDETCDDVRKAIQPVLTPDVSLGLVRLYEMSTTQLEADSMVPRIAQGQLEATDQTAKEASIRQAQSLKYVGMAIRNMDNLIEDMVQKFYDYNMNDPEITEGKGNFLVQALGFSSFINKTERLSALNNILDKALMSQDLAKFTKIRSIWEEIVKSLDIDVDQTLKSEEEIASEEELAANDPKTQLPTQAAEAAIEKDKAAATELRARAVKDLAEAKVKSDSAEQAIHDHELGRDVEPSGGQSQSGPSLNSEPME